MERRSLMSLLIGVTLCVSVWHIMLQQQQQEQFYETTSLLNDSITIPPSSTVVVVDEELPKNDFSQLIDLEDFEFVIAPKTCKELARPPTLVIHVHSAPDNFHKRTVIRETWGSQRQDTRALLLFLVGTVNSTNLQEKLEVESKKNGDVVQGSFEDSYRNLTYKHVMALKWFVYNCHEARYLLKTDDDVFINLPLMNSYLEAPTELSSPFHRGKLLFCHEIARAKVKRTYRSKWRVSYDEYLDSYFPSHCPGFVILYSADVVYQLYQEAQRQPYFWIDDVHITGNVATKLNISISPSDSLYLSVDDQRDLLAGKIDIENVAFFFAQPNLKETEIRKLWKLVENSVEITNEGASYLNNNEVESD
jgi:Galactosyltransferase